MSSTRWSNKEISDFLNICKNHNILNILKKMKSKNYRLTDVFHNIKSDMSNLGHDKSIYQMALKLKKLKKRYNEALNNPKIRQRFEYFDKMEELEKQNNDNNKNNNNIISSNNDNNNGSLYQQTINIDEMPNHYLHNYYKTPEIFDDLPYDDHMVNLNAAIADHNYDLTTFYGIEGIGSSNQQPQQINNESKKCDKENEEAKNSKDLNNTLKEFVSSFKKAQEDLQKSFFKEQFELQKQQQAWEEKILNEERQFLKNLLDPLVQHTFNRS